MDVQLHTFLIYAVAMCILFTILEMRNPSDFRPAIARATFVIIQGAWFWTVGQILYPKFGGQPWDQESHTHMMIVTMMFTWEIGVSFVFVFLLGALIMCVEKRRAGVKRLPPLDPKEDNNNGGLVYKRLAQSENVLTLLSEDEENL